MRVSRLIAPFERERWPRPDATFSVTSFSSTSATTIRARFSAVSPALLDDHRVAVEDAGVHPAVSPATSCA
jgi:hypothetical protein